jgi:dephospho-CoA kinase
VLKLKKVAVTGGLACGKSTVCALLGNLGAFVVNADNIVHQLLSNDEDTIAGVVQLLGPTMMVGQQLNRTRIANMVFSQPDLLKSLENLLHPAVNKALAERYVQACAECTATVFVAEIPLFFESGTLFRSWFDLSVCVVAGAAGQQRWRGDDYERRAHQQWPWQAKAAEADIIIDNSGSIDALEDTVQTLFHQIMRW